MRDNQYLRNIAMFLIFLVVMLPINSSAIMAASINSIQAYGNDKIVGYRGRTDIIVINVSATITEDADISPGQVKVLEDPTRPFDCELVDEVTQTFNCINEYPETTLPSTIALLDFTVQIFNDAGTYISPPRRGMISVDSKPPKVLDVDYLVNPNGIVEASYTVKDESCDMPQCTGKCAGIGSVRFTVAGLALGQTSGFEAGCVQQGKTNLTGLTVGGKVESKRICLEAADRLGQGSTQCEDVLIDAKPPEITGIGIFDVNNRPIRYTNGREPIGGVRLVLNITEDSTLINPKTGHENEIQVDASELSERPDHKEQFRSLLLPCDDRNKPEYVCRYDGLFLIATTPREITVRVEATDEHENKLNRSQAVPISFDNSPPAAARFYTDFLDDKGQYWIKEKNNSLYIDITESGAGMSNRYVFIDLNALGSQEGISGAATMVYPNSCGSAGSSWKCTWIVYTGKQSGYAWHVSTVGQSRDDANNPLPTVTSMIKVDKTPPESIGINITAISDMGKTSYVTSGDALEIHAYIEDHTPVKAFANFTMILPEPGHEDDEVECIEFAPEDAEVSAYVDSLRSDRTKRVWDCKWEIGPIVEVPSTIKRPWTNTTIMFRFVDLLKTGSEEEEYIKILGEENITADYWRFRIEDLEQSPMKGIDRFIWRLGQPVSYQHIKIVPRHGKDFAEMISFDLDATTCTGDIDYLYYTEAGSAGVTHLGFDPEIGDGIDDMVLMEFNPTNPPPAEYTTEENRSFPLDELTINCTASILSIVQDSRISMAEEENITLIVGVYGNPLGQNIGNVREEIDRIEDWVGNKWWGIITWPKLILDYAEMICTAVSTINQLRALWEAVSGGFGAACTTTGYFCGTSGSANQGQGELNTKVKGLLGKLTTFCGLVINCRATQPQAIDGTEQDKTTGEWSCTGDSGWCKFQLKWSKWNNKIINALSGGFALGEAKEKPLAMTMTKDGKETTTRAGGVQAFKGLSFADKSALRGSFDPKKSIISSLLTVCLPGIFSGIDKYRQLMCEWLLCYKINIAYGSMTMSECDELLNYGICRYVLGEVWNVVPFYQYVNELMGIVRNIAGDPFSLIGYVVDFACGKLCASGKPGTGCWLCTAIEFINVGAQAAANIGGIVKGWKSVSQDICKEALKDEPSYSKISGFPPEADPEKTTPPPGS